MTSPCFEFSPHTPCSWAERAARTKQAGTAAALQVFFQLLSPRMEGTGLAPVTLKSIDSSNYFAGCSEYPPHSSTSPSQLRPAPGAHGTPGADVREQTQRASEPPAAQHLSPESGERDDFRRYTRILQV